MTKKAGEADTNELQLELKYCERCGGLWLRPLGGGQIYCAPCGRAMAELPAVSHRARGARMPVGKHWEDIEHDLDGGDIQDGAEFDTTGGAA